MAVGSQTPEAVTNRQCLSLDPTLAGWGVVGDGQPACVLRSA